MTTTEYAIRALGRSPNAGKADPGCDPALELVEKVIAEAVAAERERCAAVCEDVANMLIGHAWAAMQYASHDVASDLAKSIRGETP